MSTLNVDKVDPSTGTDLELGTSGDTITVPTGAGLTVVDEVKTNKVSPATGTDFALGDSGDTITIPSGATIVNSGTATGFGASLRPNAKPLIINGDMAVAQRSTSVASISSGNDYYTVDRWNSWISSAGTWTSSQEALTADEAYEDGFGTALKWDCTTANGSLSAGSYLMIEQKIEAQDLQLLKFGTSNAEKLTLSFWVKSTKTGTFIIEMWQQDDDRYCSQSYTVDSTDTWEKKVVAFPADTTGVIDNNNLIGITIDWWMAAGTNFTSGTLQTTWTSGTTANRAVGQVNSADSTSNNFHITGVQLEVGEYTSSTIPPFQHESYGDNLQRCQRYCYNTNQNNTLYASLSVGAATATTGVYGELYFPVTMRDNPTGTVVQSTDYWALNAATGTDTFDSILVQNCSTTQGTIYCTGNVSQTSGQASRIRNNNTAARLLLTAEL